MLLSGALVFGAVSGWRNAHGLSGRIAAEQANLDKLNRQEQQDLAILNKPENRDVRDKSRVLNGLIRSKQFSWTLIFSGFSASSTRPMARASRKAEKAAEWKAKVSFKRRPCSATRA